MKNSRQFLLLLAPICLALMSFVIQKEGVSNSEKGLAVAAGAGLAGWAGNRLWRKKIGPAIAEKYPDKKRMGCCGVIVAILAVLGALWIIRGCS